MKKMMMVFVVALFVGLGYEARADSELSCTGLSYSKGNKPFTFTSEHDRFEGNTDHYMAHPLDSTAMLAIWVTTQGDDPDMENPIVGNRVIISWFFRTDRWKYMTNHNTVLLVDGERVTLDTSHAGQIEDDGVASLSEMVSSIMTTSRFTNMVRGTDELEWRVGNYEGGLSGEDLHGLREMACRVSR